MIDKIKENINDRAQTMIANLIYDKDAGQKILGDYTVKELIWYRDNIYIPKLYSDIIFEEDEDDTDD